MFFLIFAVIDKKPKLILVGFINKHYSLRVVAFQVDQMQNSKNIFENWSCCCVILKPAKLFQIEISVYLAI